MSAADAKILKKEPLKDDEAAWTKLVKTTYSDPNGVTRTWESAERRTRPVGSDIDGVGIVAILEKPTGGDLIPKIMRSQAQLIDCFLCVLGPEIILQKQYRPPIDQVVIEVPAGLVDANESPEQAAIRELKEETGYVATVTESSPTMFNDPGFCNTNLQMVHVKVDMTLAANQDLKPDLEENEFIQVFTVPLAQLWNTCRQLEKDGFAIDARVGTLAEGIELGKRWKCW